MAAIRTLRKLAGDLPPTEEQLATLAGYTGWGGLTQAFDPANEKWAKEYESLKKALSEDEYESARRSILDAYYTSGMVISAIYAGLERLGAGKDDAMILEPSAGTGRFMGFKPEGFKGSFTAIEPDSISAAISKHLYPNADHVNSGFEKALVGNEFDIAIGNPPYGTNTVYDSGFSQYYGYPIHNYFMAKSIDLLRDGGIAAFVISSAFLDGKNDEARRGIAEKAEFLGAIRLPSGAFRDSGTDVMTDIVFFRKDAEKQDKDTSWVETISMSFDDGDGDPHETAINAWFEGRESQILGSLEMVSGQYGWTLACKGSADGLEERIRKALSALPEDIYEPFERKVQERTREQKEFIESPYFQSLRDTAYAIEPGSGKIVQKALNDYSCVDVKNQKETARISGMIGIRDTLRLLLNEERKDNADEDEMRRLRRDLNERYDLFQKQYGYLNSRMNRALFRDDPEAGLIQGLEAAYDKGIDKSESERTGMPARPESARKADIFSQRVIRPEIAKENADSALDAMLMTLNAEGRLDFDRMGALLGVDGESVKKELSDSGQIFQIPGTGNWETRAKYLSGNVKAKLEMAKTAALEDSRFQANVAELEKVIPQDIPETGIKVELGSVWVPEKYFVDFSRYLLGENAECKVVLNNATGNFMCKCEGYDYAPNHLVFGTPKYGADQMIEAILHKTHIMVMVKENGKSVVDAVETANARQKAEEIKQAFRDWVWQDADRAKELMKIYNERFNTTIAPQYDGQFLEIPGLSNNVSLRPHQKDAVWRFLQEGRGLMDHVVGAGKTMVAIATIMEQKRMGLANKSMVVVPNNLLYQWRDEFRRLYPDANILIIEKDDFTKERRRRFFGRVANGNWDAVITTHSAFGKIPKPREEAKEIFRDDIMELDASIGSARANGMRRAVRDMEKRRNSLKVELDKLSDVTGDDYGFDFADLGIDAIFVDESQEFKNLGFATSMQVLGMGNAKGSKKASDLFAKCRFIQNRNDGKGVFFMTGTPISNSMTELFNLQRYMDIDALRKKGVATFDAWASTFASVSDDLELEATGMNYAVKSRMRTLNNVPELQAMYRSFADVVTQEQLDERAIADGLPRYVPEVEGGKPAPVICERSEAQEAYMVALVKRAENVKHVKPNVDNLLKITTEARKCGLDLRLLEPDADDFEGSKINVAARKIHEIWEASAGDLGTQLVFCDISTPKSNVPKAKETKKDEDDETKEISLDEIIAARGSGLVYHELKAKLVEMGVPEHEIAFIHDANTDARKAALYSDMNEGRRRILIGSTDKMGAGVNVQKRLVAAHHLDAPWRPSDIEQRNGRIIRQGNVFHERDPEFKVRIFNYATNGTYDARMWQAIEYKSKMIDQFREGGVQSRSMEDVSMGSVSAEEMKALASNNPLILEHARWQNQARILEADKSGFMNAQRKLNDSLSYLQGYETRLEKAEKAYKADSEARKAHTRIKDGQIVHEMLINGQPASGKDLEATVKELYEKSRKKTGDLFPLGLYRGFSLSLKRSHGYGTDGFRIVMRGMSKTIYEPRSLVFARSLPQPDTTGFATTDSAQGSLFGSKKPAIRHKSDEDVKISASAIFSRLDKAIDGMLDSGIAMAREQAAKEKGKLEQVKASIMDAYPREKELKIAQANRDALLVELRKMAADKNYESNWKPLGADDDVPDGQAEYVAENPYEKLFRENKVRFSEIPDGFKTQGMSDEYFNNNVVNCIGDIPERFRTSEMCRKAIEWHGDNMRYVPEALQTEELCRLAVENAPCCIRYIKHPSEKLCVLAVEKDYDALEWINDETGTPDLCMKAVKINGLALKHVKNQSQEIIDAAIDQNPEAEKYILVKCYDSMHGWTEKHKSVIDDAIRYISKNLSGWSEQWRYCQTSETVMAAVQYKGTFLNSVESSLRTPEVVKAAITQNPYAIQYVENPAPEICMLAVRRNGNALRYIKEQTQEMIEAAIAQDPDAEKWVRVECYDREGNKRMETRDDIVSHYWQGYQTPETIMKAVSKNGLNLEHVVKPLMTKEIVQTAIEQNPEAARFAPPEMLAELDTESKYSMKM